MKELLVDLTKIVGIEVNEETVEAIDEFIKRREGYAEEQSKSEYIHLLRDYFEN